MRRVPRQLDYSLLAMQHKPLDPQQLRAEITRLMGTGLSTRDIAEALRLDVPAVLNLLAEQGVAGRNV